MSLACLHVSFDTCKQHLILSERQTNSKASLSNSVHERGGDSAVYRQADAAVYRYGVRDWTSSHHLDLRSLTSSEFEASMGSTELDAEARRYTSCANSACLFEKWVLEKNRCDNASLGGLVEPTGTLPQKWVLPL